MPKIDKLGAYTTRDGRKAVVDAIGTYMAYGWVFESEYSSLLTIWHNDYGTASLPKENRKLGADWSNQNDIVGEWPEEKGAPRAGSEHG